MYRKLLPFFCLFLINPAAKAQQIFSNYKYPLTDFRQPLDIQPPALAGSFGELRSNHFHSGLDFRTNQRQGYPVYAAADGYISRIRVQNGGFGLALYINHPNGYTSVYAHLQRFAPKFAAYAKSQQYLKKSFELDEFPKEMVFPVYKGEIIGYSGNTGSSGGPHLHFEIRDTRTEATINPQLLGIRIPDNIPPVIHSMYVYRLNGKPFDEYTPKQYFQVIPAGSSHYQLNKVSTIHLSGEVGFGIITTDKHNGLSGTNGVYSIQLELDGKMVFTSALERFSFENSRAINAHIDYPALISSKRNIQKSFVEPGNPLRIYSNLVNEGRINFTDGRLHQLKYIITDASGNSSSLSFNVQADNRAVIGSPENKPGILMTYNKLNEFKTNEVSVILPMGTLYSDLNFMYKTAPKPVKNAYSAIHMVHNKLTPLHTGFELWIKPDSSLGALKDKAVIVNTDFVYQGGTFEQGFVKANPKAFGNFYITVDTVPPRIVPVNIAEGKNLSALSRIVFKIGDNLSGIRSFNGYIDGKWVLMEFDAKTATLWHTFDERTTAGKHKLELIVTDMKDNVGKYSAEFYRD